MTGKILVIYAGGTIGMQASETGYVPAAGFEQRLRDQLGARVAQLPTFDMLELQQLIDSANLQPHHWTELANIIVQHWQQYDGFVLLHGTDTMAYSASMLSFMLQGMDKPVIVTGSQIPLAALRNDALDNLLTALTFAAEAAIAEVCICFNGRLLRGNRATKVKSAALNAFDSPNDDYLAQVGINITLHAERLLPAGSAHFSIPELASEAVVVLPIYPGLSAHTARAILSDNVVRGCVLHTYGAGNPPDANVELMMLLQEAIERGVSIVNVTQCLQGEVSQGAYATGATLNRIGVIPGGDLTLEAAFTKLHYLIATQSAAAVSELMVKPLCGEMS
ncbi:type I asparaginase [Amphritea sp. 1_MG-2023]|uniref:type I asparaginase n=1 Tax=Amphritea sp. 1_MG-2023 TaxID=3062670 RepID=UPI0026E28C92|nr:type I asparaginase [Amphritea sp. 1_MG-2023]MDO6564328.1 type I asparaginase [Amphritea sp. 1_MG-2023]